MYFAVLGLGVSGKAAVNYLLNKNKTIYCFDDNITLDITSDNIINTHYHNWDWSQITKLVIAPGIATKYPKPHEAVLLAQKNNVAIISDMELFILDYQESYNVLPNIIAITGTNGKSTLTALMSHIMHHCHLNYEMGGNIGISPLQKPMQQQDYFLWEVSSYQLEITPSLKPKYAALLNITADHLARHKDINGYREAKSLIFKNQDKHDYAFISLDDKHCDKIYHDLLKNDTQRIVTVSMNSNASYHKADSKLLDESGEEIFDASQPTYLKGEHNLQNIAFALAMCEKMNLDMQLVVSAILTFKGLAHRQEFVGKYQNITFINDSKATNYEAMSKAINAYDNIILLLGGLAKENDELNLEQKELEKILAIFAYGKNGAAMLNDFPTKQKSYTEELNHSFNQAIEFALSQSHKVTLLLSPAAASWDQYKNFEQRGDEFKTLVHNLCYTKT